MSEAQIVEPQNVNYLILIQRTTFNLSNLYTPNRDLMILKKDPHIFSKNFKILRFELENKG